MFTLLRTASIYSAQFNNFCTPGHYFPRVCMVFVLPPGLLHPLVPMLGWELPPLSSAFLLIRHPQYEVHDGMRDGGNMVLEANTITHIDLLCCRDYTASALIYMQL